jgi:hypothetical protein
MPELTLKAVESLLAEKLIGLATQKDLERFATKDDLLSETRSLKVKLDSIETKVDRLSRRTEEEHAAVVRDAEGLTGRIQSVENRSAS